MCVVCSVQLGRGVMSASAAVISRSWRVGDRTSTLTVSAAGPNGERSAVIEWEPDRPSNLTPPELDEYRRGRNAAFRGLGLSALVIEV